MDDYAPPINHETVEIKYESLYYDIIQTLVDGVKERVSETNNTIIFIYSIFTQDSSDLTCESLEAKLSVYKDNLDIKELF